MKQTAETLGEKLSDSIREHLNKIDFDSKKWKHSGIHCNKITSLDDAISKIINIYCKLCNFLTYITSKFNICGILT